jgi:hypothetical protein
VTRRELQPERKLKHWFSNSVREAAEDPFLEPAAPRCLMKSRYVPVLALLVLISVTLASAGSREPSLPPQISKRTRMVLIRGFNAELVYVRSSFPMGKRGLVLKNGKLSPGGEELQRMLAISGPAVKPGDQARISQIVIKDDRIRFEINGGPLKKQKWYQHISVGGNGGTTSIAPSAPTANPRGSYVDLAFDHYVPDLNPQQLKDLLRPVFDFNAKSVLEAYLETVPLQAKDAIKNHRVLVGMNREMVIYAKGRPPKKIREKDGETDYEDWIYGESPQDVEFVRLVGDEVVRVETIDVRGEKIIRAENEVNLEQPTLAKEQELQAHPVSPPTLRRPGEEPASAPPQKFSAN